MAQRLAKEPWDAARNEGKAVSVRANHRMAELTGRRPLCPLSGKVPQHPIGRPRDASGVPGFVHPPIARLPP